jgi:hypothetical protein
MDRLLEANAYRFGSPEDEEDMSGPLSLSTDP